MLRLQVFKFTQLVTKGLEFKLFLYNTILSLYDSALNIYNSSSEVWTMRRGDHCGYLWVLIKLITWGFLNLFICFSKTKKYTQFYEIWIFKKVKISHSYPHFSFQFTYQFFSCLINSCTLEAKISIISWKIWKYIQKS